MAQPELARDVLFGAQAVLALDGRMAGAILAAWEAGESSLRPEPSASLAPV